MSPLDRTLHQAARRMRVVRLLEILLQNLAVLLMLLIGVILLDKSGLVVLADWSGTGVWHDGHWTEPNAHVPPLYWQTLVPCAVALALLVGLLRLERERYTPEFAALSLDDRLGLSERLTTARMMGERPLALAAAVVGDANAVCTRVQPQEVFPLRAGWGGPKLPWLLAGLAVLVVLMPDLDLRGVREEQRKEQLRQEQNTQEVKRMASGLQQTAKELRKRVRTNPAEKKRLEDLIKRMEELARKMKDDKAIDPTKARQEISKLQDKIREDARAEKLKQMKLQQLQTPDNKNSMMKDIVDKLKKNDFDGAGDQMRRLRRRLTKRMEKDEIKQLEKDMRDLAKQLDRMELKQLSRQFEELSDEMKAMRESGQFDKLEALREKLQDTLKQLQQDQTPDLSKLTDEERKLLQELQEMLMKMDYTEQQLRDMQDAADRGQVRQLTAEELKNLLQELKKQQQCQQCQGSGQTPCKTCNGTGKDADGNPCKDCQGTGQGTCDACGGSGKNPGGDGNGQEPGNGNGSGSGSGGLTAVPMPGSGNGSGSGSGNGNGTGGAGQGRGGRPPELRDSTREQESVLRARRITRGKIVGQTFVRGLPPTDHELETEYLETVETVEGAEETARERESIPLEDRDLIRDYNNAIKGIRTP